MKNFYLYPMYRFSLLIILTLLAAACKKRSITPEAFRSEVYTVKFDFKDFESITNPLNNRARQSLRSRNFRADAGSQTTTYQGMLYYWSFNEETLSPDISLASGTTISYNEGESPTDFAAGWAYDEFVAGRSMSIRGLAELLISVPLSHVHSLDDFGFDISSSNTGPKAFDAYYSFDGEQWQDLNLGNQFSSLGASHPKNTFTFDMISDVPLAGNDMLYIRLEFAAGERLEGSNYSPTTGVTRLDNIRFIGTGDQASSTGVIDALHYYVFDQSSGELIGNDVVDFDPSNPTLTLNLNHGFYQISFIRNHSDETLAFPSQLYYSSEYFYTNIFSNYLARIFANEIELLVTGNVSEEVELNRYYSQVKFEFTDTQDLSVVHRIVISPTHDPYFYAPFNSSLSPSFDDGSLIEVQPDFSTSQEFVFNQFLGYRPTATTVAYHLEAYDASDNLLRALDVEASIRNNVQLVFRGQLLSGGLSNTDIQFHINEDWDENGVEVEF